MDGCVRLAGSSMSIADERQADHSLARAARLLESERGLQQDLAVERYANEAYEHYRAHGQDSQGRRLSRPPKPYEPPDIPSGKINTTDPDSRNIKTPRSYTQGYNAPRPS